MSVVHYVLSNNKIILLGLMFKMVYHFLYNGHHLKHHISFYLWETSTSYILVKYKIFGIKTKKAINNVINERKRKKEKKETGHSNMFVVIFFNLLATW